MSYLKKIAPIKAFVFDVDGVFTDGNVILMPGGNMCRKMSVLDGYAIVKALKAGYKIGVITGGNDQEVKHRLNYLGITDYYPKSLDKLKDYIDFKYKYDLKDHEITMMGDDLPDIPVLQKVGLPTCPANSVAEVKVVADYISPISGGEGAVRDLIELVMRGQNVWKIDEEIASQ